MPITNDDLQNFYQFALGVISADKPKATMQELVDQWDAQRERDSVNESIRKGHAEISAGGGRPYEEFRSELMAKYDSSSDG
jgi:hypothetical protein